MQHLNTCRRCGLKWDSNMIETICDDCLLDNGGAPFYDPPEISTNARNIVLWGACIILAILSIALLN